MAITKALADTYFVVTTHPHGQLWKDFHTNDRTAAITYCIAHFQRIFDENYDDDATTSTDFPRMDAAVYEQALHVLRTSGTANGDKTAPRYTGDAEAIFDIEFKMSPAAQQWLYARGSQVKICLG